MISLSELVDYNKYVENTFLNRYINPFQLHDFLLENYNRYIKKIGHSTLGLPIFKLTLGKGPFRVLAWTQMHGNESTATLAFLDFLHAYMEDISFQNIINSEFTIDIVLMLNPDGSLHWKRENALGIDVNRDFASKRTTEMNILLDLLNKSNYQLALNCHDQRSIFGNPRTNRPATISLLAPSIGPNNQVNEARSKAMQVISRTYQSMSSEFRSYVTRFDETYYPDATGDNIQSMNIPTILIEAGYYPNDYDRRYSREMFTNVIYSILQHCKEVDPPNSNIYYDIPESSKNHFDVIIRNINLNSNGFVTKLAVGIQFKEVLNHETKKIDYYPIIQKINNLEEHKGWQEFDLSSKTFHYKEHIFMLNESAENLINYLEVPVKYPGE